MMMTISLFSVATAVIANLIIGMIWYAPKVFGKKWAKAHGFDVGKLKTTQTKAFGSILVSIVTVVTIEMMLKLFRINTVGTALEFGAMAWLAFIATSHFSGVIWCKQPILGYFIEVGQLLVSTLVISVLLVIL